MEIANKFRVLCFSLFLSAARRTPPVDVVHGAAAGQVAQPPPVSLIRSALAASPPDTRHRQPVAPGRAIPGRLSLPPTSLASLRSIPAYKYPPQCSIMRERHSPSLRHCLSHRRALLRRRRTTSAPALPQPRFLSPSPSPSGAIRPNRAGRSSPE